MQQQSRPDSVRFWFFSWIQLKRCLRGKKLLILGSILILPVLLSVYLFVESKASRWEDIITMVGVIYLPLLLPLIALFYAGPIIVEELEQHTYLYLVVRPIPRYQIYLGKNLAAYIMTVSLVGLSLLLFLAFQLPMFSNLEGLASDVALLVIALLLGASTYITLFSSLASLFGRSTLAGILYYILFEGFLGRLPVLEYLSIRYHLYNLIDFTREKTTAELLLNQGVEVSQVLSGIVLLVGTLFFLGAGSFLSSVREYKG